MPLAPGELLALTGMMAAGKSTVARALGARLERQVVSTDAMLESRFGKPIPRIFAEDGEPAFRAAERAIIERLDGRLVVDLGGGTFCDPVSAARLLAAGKVVFLDISPAAYDRAHEDDELVRHSVRSTSMVVSHCCEVRSMAKVVAPSSGTAATLDHVNAASGFAT